MSNNTLHANITHAKARAGVETHAIKKTPQNLASSFGIDARVFGQIEQHPASSEKATFRLQFLETTRLQKVQASSLQTQNQTINVQQLFAPRLAVITTAAQAPLQQAALQRNFTALAWYNSLHGTMQYKLGESDIRANGKGDCTSFDEFIANQFGHADNTSERWHTRKMWQTGYQMQRVNAKAILPGDQIVVPPKGKTWPQNSKSEPEGVGHAGIFVLDNGNLKIMHASSIYGTVVLSSPQEFMENRLDFKIFRPQGKGRYALPAENKQRLASRV